MRGWITRLMIGLLLFRGPKTVSFDRPFHLILNLAVGSHWPGYPDENSVFPEQMFVVFVRIYQKRIPSKLLLNIVVNCSEKG